MTDKSPDCAPVRAAGEPHERPSDTLLMMRATQMAERLIAPHKPPSGADVHFIYEQLQHVRRYAASASPSDYGARQRELGEARADVVRMATTKVGERCEHHTWPMERLEMAALRECPICWKECAESLQRQLDALAAASDDGAARQSRLRALLDALAVLEGCCGADDRTAAYAVAGAARAYVDSLTTADDGAARPQPAQDGYPMRLEDAALEVVKAIKRDYLPDMDTNDGGQILAWLLQLVRTAVQSVPLSSSSVAATKEQK